MSKPWTVEEYPSGAEVRSVSLFCKGVRIAAICEHHMDRDRVETVPRTTQRRYAREMAATLNACEGINPEAVPDLLKAAREMVSVLRHAGYTDAGTIDRARAAIAKAEQAGVDEELASFDDDWATE